MSEGTLKVVPLSEIEESSVALRPAQKNSEQYLGLVESIRNKGFVGTILVRPIDSENGDRYEVIDGTQRFNACKDLGHETIKVLVKEMNKEDVMETQLMSNYHRVNTTPVQYTRQLKAMIGMNPTMTLDELARKLGVSSTFISNRLSLLKLNEDIQPLVDDGKIKLSNGQALAKLSEDEQKDFVEQAMLLSPDEFAAVVKDRLDEIRKAKNTGEKAPEKGFTPVSKLRKLKEIEPILENQAEVRNLISGITDPEEAAIAVLEWVVSRDEESIKIQKAKYDEREAAKKEAAEKRKLEKLKKKEEEAAEERAKLEASIS